MNGFLNIFQATARAVLLLAALGLFCAAQAEEADGAARANGDASEPAAGSLLPKDLFSGDSLFSRLSDRVHFSGFARLVGGYLDAEDVHYAGYDDTVSFGQHSLLALQTDVDLTETLSFTTQLLAHTSAARKSGVEWAYLTWRPSNRWNFKAGKMRTPFYLHSDTIDVGYSYPWIIPPQQVYTPYLFPDFTGLSAAYQFNLGAFDIETEAYWGNFEGAATVEDESPADVKADNMRGLILEAWRGNLHLRASYHLAQAEVKFPRPARLQATQLIEGLRRFRFNRSANSLNTTGDVSFMQAAISYEALDYFLKAEWARMRADVFTIQPYDGYYLSGGYTFYPFELPITAHATFASLTATGIPSPANEISTSPFFPPRVNAQLNALQSAYAQAFDIRRGVSDDLQSLRIGLRWDVNPSVALKAEWVRLRGERGKRSLFTVDQAPDFDRKANLFLLALEWVF